MSGLSSPDNRRPDHADATDWSRLGTFTFWKFGRQGAQFLLGEHLQLVSQRDESGEMIADHHFTIPLAKVQANISHPINGGGAGLEFVGPDFNHGSPFIARLCRPPRMKRWKRVSSAEPTA